MQATFEPDGICFANYPFRPASIGRCGRIGVAEIRDVDPSCGPPEIRTHLGETLFVSAEQRNEFQEWISSVQLPIVPRRDVWGLLLEPFLDTEFTAEWRDRSLVQLEELGISRMETSRIRRSVEGAMIEYNFRSMLWDWVHLGLFDVLLAVRRGWSWRSLVHRVSRTRDAAFYWRAMELAEFGRNDPANAGLRPF